MEKKCFKCGFVKPVTEFYRHAKMADGYLNKCKECTKKDVRSNRVKNLDYYREYDRKRFQDDPRVRERNQRYAKETYRPRNPEKYAANILLNNAIRKGSIEKPTECSSCGKRGRIHGHHDDYTKPLHVQWLCPACHKREHMKEGTV